MLYTGGAAVKSVHFQVAKIKHFYKLENRFTFAGSNYK